MLGLYSTFKKKGTNGHILHDCNYLKAARKGKCIDTESRLEGPRA